MGRAGAGAGRLTARKRVEEADDDDAPRAESVAESEGVVRATGALIRRAMRMVATALEQADATCMGCASRAEDMSLRGPERVDGKEVSQRTHADLRPLDDMRARATQRLSGSQLPYVSRSSIALPKPAASIRGMDRWTHGETPHFVWSARTIDERREAKGLP